MEPLKVLLIEDEDAIRDLYKRQLDLAGFSTDAFANGKDGLAALSQNKYTTILLDIMLPDLNGLQILKEIKSNEKTKTISVVLLTNLGQDAIIKEGFQLGADGYLVKAAYTPDQIIQELKNILTRKGINVGGTPQTTPQQAPPPVFQPIPPSPNIPVAPQVPVQPGQAGTTVTPPIQPFTPPQEPFTPVAPSAPPTDDTNNSGQN